MPHGEHALPFFESEERFGEPMQQQVGPEEVDAARGQRQGVGIGYEGLCRVAAHEPGKPGGWGGEVREPRRGEVDGDGLGLGIARA